MHRLGRKEGLKIRPVILHFGDYEEKMTVLKNCNRLKGSKISVQQDFSKETLRTRKLLWESAMPNKRNGDKVFLVRDRLHINGDIYSWDDIKQTRVLLSTKSAPVPDQP